MVMERKKNLHGHEDFLNAKPDASNYQNMRIYLWNAVDLPFHHRPKIKLN